MFLVEFPFPVVKKNRYVGCKWRTPPSSDYPHDGRRRDRSQSRHISFDLNFVILLDKRRGNPLDMVYTVVQIKRSKTKNKSKRVHDFWSRPHVGRINGKWYKNDQW